MKERININSKNLRIKVDEEYLYCDVKEDIELKISIELLFNIVKCVYCKIREHKEIV